ncbi:Holliday junction resolvase RuvX [Anaerosalibacter massiliensis]|uniref:Putative pre-16S rRNA nuclease n=1 Tax=Anaerosalibacter massiliensis TaxID=1347392 RepID=A0A9X2MFW4_9FIRM|nr:Holliday junction resolvase RuvX [Anaerosalibacter massiliensis]MCR2042836.1 Holliday junction resolvase RuvX [Anaerosalibacter massiliensis]
MERILGIDVGDKTIGVAVSDPLGLTAQGIITIERNGIKNDFKALKSIIDEYEIAKIVVGFPKNMNNTIGPQGEKVLEFVEEIKKEFELEIILEDERLTTVAAEKLLINGDVSRKKRKKVIDKVAATYILQTYLDKNY